MTVINLAWWNKVKKEHGSKHLPTLGLTPAFKKHDTAWSAFESKPSLPTCDAAAKALKALDLVRKDALTALDKAMEQSSDVKKALTKVHKQLKDNLNFAIEDNLKVVEQKKEALGLEREVSRTNNKHEAEYITLMDQLVKLRNAVEEKRSPEGYEQVLKLTTACQKAVDNIVGNDPTLKASWKGKTQILASMERETLLKQEEFTSSIEAYLEMHKKVKPVLNALNLWTTDQAKTLALLLPKGGQLNQEQKNELWEKFSKFDDEFWERATIFKPGTPIRNYRFERLAPKYMLELSKIFDANNTINKSAANVRDKLVPLFEKVTGKKAQSRV